ncbi:MAG: mannosyltransferase family protein [Ktedonobacterales bacterium]
MHDTAMDNTGGKRMTGTTSGQVEAPFHLPPVLLPQADNLTWTAHAPAHRPALPWRRITLNALLIWAITRVAFIALTYMAAGLPQAKPIPGAGFFSVWQRWDTNWYLGIAQQGYAIPQQVGFFPVYPLLIRLVSFPLGGNTLLAALLVSNLSTLLALIGLGALATWEARDEGIAVRAMILMLAFPFAFYLTAAYTEGLFIAIVAFCLLYARQGRWGFTPLLVLLAGATRPTGVVLVLPLAWEWLRQNGLLERSLWRPLFQRRDGGALKQLGDELRERALIAIRRTWPGLASLVMIPGFYLLFMAFVGLRFGHPLLVFNVHRDYWGAVSEPIWTSLAREISNLALTPYASLDQVTMVLDLVTIAVVTVAIVILWRSTPGMYNIYMLCLLYVAMAEPSVTNIRVLQSPGRYLLPAIPIFIVLSGKLERRPALAGALVTLGCILQCYIGLRFLTGSLLD